MGWNKNRWDQLSWGSGQWDTGIDLSLYAWYPGTDWSNLITGDPLDSIGLLGGRYNDISGALIGPDEANIDPNNTLNIGPGSYSNRWFSEINNGSEPTYIPSMGISYTGISIENQEWPSIITSSKAVYFLDNAIQRQYRLGNVPYDIGDTYTISFFVVMDDGGVPVPSAVTGVGDFWFYRQFTSGDIGVRHIAGDMYQVWATSIKNIAADTTGIRKDVTQSNRGFSMSGFMINEGTIKPYVKTEDTVILVPDNTPYSYPITGALLDAFDDVGDPAKGQLELSIIPKFNSADITGTQTMISLDGVTPWVSYNADLERFELTDGITTAVVPYTAVRDTELRLIAKWGDDTGQKMQLIVDATEGAKVTALDTFSPGADMVFEGDPNWWKLKNNPKPFVLKEVTW